MEDQSTLLDVMRRLRNEAPSHPLVSFEGGTLTRAAFDDLSNKAANGLLSLGCKKGDRIALLTQNCDDWLVFFFGILKIGASAVPLSPMVPGAVINRMLIDSAATALLLSSRSAEEFGADFEMACPVPEHARIVHGANRKGWISYASWIDEHSAIFEVEDVTSKDEFNIIYSSGTTGTPKGIVHPHQLRLTQAKNFSAFLFNEHSHTVISTGLYTQWSVLGVLTALYAGGAMTILPTFRPESFIAENRAAAFTHAFLVPAQIERLLDHPHFDSALASAEIVKFTAGSPLSEKRKREVIKRWPGPTVEVYGMTEGFAATAFILNDNMEKLASVGKPLPGGELEIIDEQGGVLPAGEIGEIAGRTEALMAGYNNLPVETANAEITLKDGRQYFRTGDLGYLDEDGYLFLAGRKKDMIISGGINVYASDIENVLSAHPDVAECAVIGAPSKTWGETPLGVVVKKPGSPVTDEKIISWANARLAKYQRLTGIEFVDALPRGVMDKVLKKELRSRFGE